MDAPGKRSPKGAWKRISLVLACFLIVAVFLGRGTQEMAPPETPEDPGDLDVHIPLPPMPEAEPPAVRARGAYQLQAPGLQVTLELMRERRFRFLSTRQGDAREATGTWSLAGSRLTLAYREVDGTFVGEKPIVVVNTWHGTTIELKDTGIPGPVILTKRTMIRGR